MRISDWSSDVCSSDLSHFWYPVSSGAERTDKGWHVRKKASWTTSGGFADWYIVQTTSPDFGGNYADLSCFLIRKEDAKADPSKWDGLGLRGNQSGTRSEEHTSELQSLMRTPYAVFCLKK